MGRGDINCELRKFCALRIQQMIRSERVIGPEVSERNVHFKQIETATPARRSNVKRFLRVAVISLAVGGALFWAAEKMLRHRGLLPDGVFWMAGDDWWAPNYGRCAFCGTILIPQVDESSACRHCPQCRISFRHSLMPQTLEEQSRVWK